MRRTKKSANFVVIIAVIIDSKADPQSALALLSASALSAYV